MWRDDAYLLDMLLAGRKALKFIAGTTAETFCADEILQNATMRQIQIIGEAARMVSAEFKQSHPEVPWTEIVGMRNRLVHEYFDIIPERVWEVIERHVPPLLTQLEPLVPPDNEA
jgi:uncharacterized protein with HEPN domain